MPTIPFCDNCGHPVPEQGVTLPAAVDRDYTGRKRPRCSDTACVVTDPDKANKRALDSLKAFTGALRKHGWL
jgi:hypothetical protein